MTTLEGIRRCRDARWRLMGGQPGNEAFRVVDGAGDGVPGVFVDELAGHWLVHTKGGVMPSAWLGAVETGLCSAIWWQELDNAEKRAPVCLAGSADASFVVREAGVQFEIQPDAGYNCGLFIDQRSNRQRVRWQVDPGQRVLNLFAYTCSFSVVAALAGATVTSVDLNRSYLEWGKRNFGLNGLRADTHHWVRGDSFEWLGLFAKKARLFEGVVVDPPTFSRGKTKKVFRVEQDYAELAGLAAAVVAPGGWLLCCANTHRQSPEAFGWQVDTGIRSVGRRFAKREWMAMPADFTGEPYLKALWLSDAD